MALDNIVEFPHKGNSLEQKVDSGFWGVVKQLNWKDYLVMGGSTAASLATAGIGMTATFIIGNLLIYGALTKWRAKKPMTKKGFLAEYIFANIMAPGFDFGYRTFLSIGYLPVRIAIGLGIMVPISFAFYFVTKNLLHNYTMKEFAVGLFNGKVYTDSYTVLQNNLWPAYKKTLTRLAPFLIAFWTFVPEHLQKILHATIGIAGRLGFKAYVDKDIEEVFKKEDESPQENVIDAVQYKKDQYIPPNVQYQDRLAA